MSTALRALRTCAGLLVLALLIYSGRIDLRVLEHALGHPGALALAAGLLLAAIPMAALRWWLLTSALGFPMSYAWSVRTTLTGQFFNVFLPGAIGGDLIRVSLARRVARRGLSQLTFSVLMDRLSGLAALVLLGFGALPIMPERFHQPAYLVPWAIGCTTVLAGFVVAVLWGHLIADLLGRLPGPIGRRLSFSAHEVLAALRAYADQWLTLVWTLAISAINFLMTFAALASLGAAMAFNSLSPAGYVVAGIWASMVNTIPLTPGGLGLGEAAFAQIAVMLESVPSGASYANAFLAMRILSILVSILGLLPYLAQRGDLLGAAPTDTDAPAASETQGT